MRSILAASAFAILSAFFMIFNPYTRINNNEWSRQVALRDSIKDRLVSNIGSTFAIYEDITNRSMPINQHS